MTKLNKSDIGLDYDSDSEVEPKSTAKLMAKLKKFNSDKNQIKMLYLQYYQLLLMMIIFYY